MHLRANPSTIVIDASFPNATLVPQGRFGRLEPVGIGRPLTLIGSGQRVHVRLRSRTISSLHAALLNADGRVIVRDLASGTHVYVNGRLVREAVLKAGDEIRLGRIRFRFQPGEPAVADASLETEPKAPEARLWHSGGEIAAVNAPIFVIGARRDTDLVLLDEGVADAHAMLFAIGPYRLVRDLGAPAGTSVSGTKITQASLKSGDVICIGETELQYEASGPQPFSAGTGIASLIASAQSTAADTAAIDPLAPDAAMEKSADDWLGAQVVIDDLPVPPDPSRDAAPEPRDGERLAADPRDAVVQDAEMRETAPAPEPMSAHADLMACTDEIPASGAPAELEAAPGEETAGDADFELISAGPGDVALALGDPGSLLDSPQDVIAPPVEAPSAQVADPVLPTSSSSPPALTSEAVSASSLRDDEQQLDGSGGIDDLPARDIELELSSNGDTATVPAPATPPPAPAAPPIMAGTRVDARPSATPADFINDDVAPADPAARAPVEHAGDAGTGRARARASIPPDIADWGPLALALASQHRPELLSTTSSSTASPPAASPRRHIWRWLLTFLILIVIAGAAAWAGWLHLGWRFGLGQ